MAHRRGGFTLVEVLVAIVVLEVGLLGHLATTILVGAVIARSERSAGAALARDARLEHLRSTACVRRADSAEVRYYHQAPVDSLSWRFVAAGNQCWRLMLRSHYLVELNHWRTDSVTTEISCLR
jgi:prepilin-type N-terminal cleavage/methylation domain-containing protein